MKRNINETSDKVYTQVDDLLDYAKQNNLTFKRASKYQRINAHPAKHDEQVATIASDGTAETTNTAKDGDWIVNNTTNPNNKWIVDNQTFQKKYTPVEGTKDTYKPKGNPMDAAQIHEPISFIAPWGQRMNIDDGGYILQDPTNPTDIYGISREDFDNTYRFDK